ncbi:DEAD/DEAH box helicase [Nocardia panacis]|uniref:DEAD/DEAH box helicase n=1 Tax=Nocardia panacis TaxID=2340916 RepID=A0A3A4KGU5_9NOCA|nr:DEAD/DEAH box helicase [Nocardia panacis]
MTRSTSASFAELGLPAVLVQALRRDGIEAPFPIQAATIADALAGRDVLGRGPTGSGKTLAFGLPMVTRLAGSPAKPTRPVGLILAPTRELAAQIERSLDEPARALGLRIASVVGGAPIKRQADRLARGVDLLIATPGRLADLVAQGSADLSEVRITALDEADHMADMGFLPQVTKLLDRTPKHGQRLLFSATLDGEVDKLVRRYLTDPITHSTAPPAASVTTMTHHLLFVDKGDKRAVLTEIAARTGRTIIFVRTKYGADRLAKQLRATGIEVGALHGGKAQNNRTRTLSAFAEGDVPVLICTDVAARGIHVDDISLVVHADPPAESKSYLHRAGRTARAGAEGTVVTLVTAEERADVEKMTRKAGIDIEGVNVRPGDARLVAITGARAGAAADLPEPGANSRRRGGQTARTAAETSAPTGKFRRQVGDTATRAVAKTGRGAGSEGSRRSAGRAVDSDADRTTRTGHRTAQTDSRTGRGRPQDGGRPRAAAGEARTGVGRAARSGKPGAQAGSSGRAGGAAAARSGAEKSAARSGQFGAGRPNRGDTPGGARRHAGASGRRNRGAN